MPSIFWLVPGVVMPLAALGTELVTRMCADAFFDPLPTVAHVLLVALVPAANLFAWRVARQAAPRHLALARIALGASIGVALFYAILFLPLTPIAFVAVIWFGIGLLPLAPLFAFLSAVRLRYALPGSPAGGRAVFGFALALAALVALELPSTITRIGAQMALATDAASRARGVALIRLFGSEDLLLRLCYGQPGGGRDLPGALFNMVDPVQPEDARRLYYRVTGTAFNSVPAPMHRRAASPFGQRGRWDADQGGGEVAGKVEGLSLAASRMDGSLDAEAALGYVEWTMVFRNASQAQREARALIALPPGGVVSRLTLWIDGEEREAAFAGRAAVREAYEKVVRQQRDPVLVTTAGPDRVLMQLFPVPPGGGEMRVRVGITLPLAPRSRGESALRLPRLEERNFEMPRELSHAVWIESKQGSLRKDIKDAELAALDAALVLPRSRTESWSVDAAKHGYYVRQRLVDPAAGAPPRLVVVVDGSVSTGESAPRVARALERLPAGAKVELLFADDSAAPDAQVLDPAGAARRIRSHRYAGGQDNVPALARALDLLADGKGVLLWIAGPQPVLLDSVEPLLQRLERSRAPDWQVYQVRPGVNQVLKKLDGRARVGMLEGEDLERLASGRLAGVPPTEVERFRFAAAGPGRPQEEKTSDHLARLWAQEEVLRLAALQDAAKRAQAARLAQEFRLVTPVTGAVVLETQKQYEDAGLEPPQPGKARVPGVPEPEVWALLAAAALALAHAQRTARRRRQLARAGGQFAA